MDQSWIEVEEPSPKVVMAAVKSDPGNQIAGVVEGPALLISLIDDDEERYPEAMVLQKMDEEEIEDVHIESYIDGRQVFYKQVQIILDDVKAALTEVGYVT